MGVVLVKIISMPSSRRRIKNERIDSSRARATQLEYLPNTKSQIHITTTKITVAKIMTAQTFAIEAAETTKVPAGKESKSGRQRHQVVVLSVQPVPRHRLLRLDTPLHATWDLQMQLQVVPIGRSGPSMNTHLWAPLLSFTTRGWSVKVDVDRQTGHRWMLAR